jgi:Cof subfamily protein (haloacid dehalogenase superfamily)
MIKLIATDMDGTLLDSQKRLPEELESVVRALKAQDVRFIIASGRQAATLGRDLGELSQDMIFFAENGTVVMEDGKRLFVSPMEKTDVRRVLEKTRGMEGMHAVLCRPDVAMIEESAPEVFRRNVKMYYESTQIVPDLLAICDEFDDVCKIAFYDEGDAEHHEYPVLKEWFEDTLSVILSGYSWVDLMQPGVNKGSAMRRLQAMKGILPEECMAFGDYLNDKEMLEAVGESYAMANGLEEIKAVCKYIAPSNDENGVMRVIKERFSL